MFDALQVKLQGRRQDRQRLRRPRVAVKPRGLRESLGLDVVTSEDGAAWLAFLRGLVSRGLLGVRFVTQHALFDTDSTLRSFA